MPLGRLDIPPSVVFVLLCTDVGGVTPRLLGGSVGEYGLISLPVRLWYRVMGDQSVLSFDMGDRVPFMAPFIARRSAETRHTEFGVLRGAVSAFRDGTKDECSDFRAWPLC
jgi:hypothetical protein